MGPVLLLLEGETFLKPPREVGVIAVPVSRTSLRFRRDPLFPVSLE